MTYALGFVASRSPAFAAAFARSVGAELDELSGGEVYLQKVDGDGRTDVEIRLRDRFHAVIEAKRGPHLPTEAQLRKYVARFRECSAKTSRLVAVTNVSHQYAKHALPSSLEGVPVKHVAWREIRNLVRRVRASENNKTKHLLDEFDVYLTEILGMETIRSNMVYVVSLGGGGAWGIDFKEVVNRHRRYFFPTEGRYPKVPPNYIAFRYGGRLQSIHHVESYEVFDNPRRFFEEANNSKVDPHYLLKLGPAIRPPREVKNGPKIKMAMRVWCMLDLLLTSETITEARDETQRRLGEDASEAADDDG